ncbi:MAG: ABC transporter substrate-binding protein [Microthrixaceae bacterium]
MSLKNSRGRFAVVATVAALALVAAACGGGDSEDSSSDDGGDSGGSSGVVGPGEDGGTPAYGGEVTYGLEAENQGGWCLPEGQLAISGIQVAKTIYDTLTAPNADGDYVPFLAESVEPNEDNTLWTITLREGITFHDGSPLTAEVVKNNLDAYRGQYAAREPLLFLFVFDNITSVDVVDDLTLTVSTETPWPALPSFLYGSGRIGILAQAQLDDTETCDTNLIGTGPFELEEWQVNDSLSATRNPNYWQTDSDGNQLPYLDKITYRPFIEEDARANALLGGQLNAMHTNDPERIPELQAEAESGNITLWQSDEYSEVSYVMFNSSKAPFDNKNARQAVGFAIDRDQINTVRFLDVPTMASGPFAQGSVGYLEDTGFPETDLEAARGFAEAYEAETGQPLSFSMTIYGSVSTQQTVQLIQQQLAEIGVEMNIESIDQAQQISTAIGNDWQSQYWRNHPGGDPDDQYVWWNSESPVNFGKFADPEIDDLLARGRASSDPAERTQIYEELNREFADELYNVWMNWSVWTIATATDVKGVFGPDLPDGSAPFPGLATGNPVSGMWIEQ